MAILSPVATLVYLHFPWNRTFARVVLSLGCHLYRGGQEAFRLLGRVCSLLTTHGIRSLLREANDHGHSIFQKSFEWGYGKWMREGLYRVIEGGVTKWARHAGDNEGGSSCTEFYSIWRLWDT